MWLCPRNSVCTSLNSSRHSLISVNSWLRRSRETTACTALGLPFSLHMASSLVRLMWEPSPARNRKAVLRSKVLLRDILMLLDF